MNELALFSGVGGGILGGHLLGWRTVCAVEIEPYPASVLLARQNDGILPPFPVWDNVCTFDGRPWRGIVDVVSGGFPCQDISVAGKGAGISGERSGMWSHMARIIGEVRPRFAFVENSPALLTRGLGVVLSDLAALGYDCKWTVLGAADVGAPHQRDRFWLVANSDRWNDQRGQGQRPRIHSQKRGEGSDDHIGGSGETRAVVADPDSLREPQPQGCEPDERGRLGNCGAEGGDADSTGLEKRQGQPSHTRQELKAIERADWWLAEPDVGRVAHGVAARVDRLRSIGNGQVSLVAATAWRMLTQ